MVGSFFQQQAEHIFAGQILDRTPVFPAANQLLSVAGFHSHGADSFPFCMVLL
jgi:hypothetical protein